MIFADRSEAGKRLATALEGYRGCDVVVLALPRGGLPVAAEVAAHLGAPLDILLVRKLGVPIHPELAMGAIIDGDKPIIVRNEDVIRMAAIPEATFEREARTQLAEIERRRARYLGQAPALDVRDKIAIVVDDGIATGATVRAAIRGLQRRHPAKIILAVPVAAADVVAALRQEADEVVCLSQPDVFEAVGSHYRDFRQLSDEDVVSIMKAARSAVNDTSQAERN